MAQQTSRRAKAAKPSYIPSREELVREARKLVPTLRERAQATDELRTLPDETVADLKAAGIHKIFAPRRYGGFEMDWGTHVDVSRELGRGCASTSWVVSVVMSHTWMLGRFPVRAQEEFWPDQPDTIIATAFAGGGKMEPVDGGYILSGQWRFASGVDHANCAIVGGRYSVQGRSSEGTLVKFRMAHLLPGEYEIVDTWHAEGLKGTGSKDILVKELFVPEYRTVLSDDLAGAEPPGAKLHESYIYRVELQQYFYSLLCGPMLGATRGGLEHYLEQTLARKGQMFGESIVEQIPVQMRVAESFEELRVADLITDSLMDFLHEAGSSGRKIRGIDRLRIRREPAMAAKLCMSSITRLANMMGVTAQTGNNPVQRHFRDMRTISTHGGINWDNAMTPTGKLLLGLPTGDSQTDVDIENS